MRVMLILTSILHQRKKRKILYELSKDEKIRNINRTLLGKSAV